MLIENVDIINRRLADIYGKLEDKPNYRVIFSEDLLEKRWTDKTKDGFQLLNPEIREVPKYRQWIHRKYVLERLTFVPEITDLTTELSYEPIWVFETSSGEALAPNWLACRMIIDTVNENIEQAGNYRKYKDPDEKLTKEQLYEKKRVELEELTQALFPGESETGDALHYKEGVSVQYGEHHLGGKRIEIK